MRLTLELALAQRWGVAGDDDKLGFAGSERLEGGLVAKGDCKYVPSVKLFCLCSGWDIPTFAGLHHKCQSRVDAVGRFLGLLGWCHRCASEMTTDL